MDAQKLPSPNTQPVIEDGLVLPARRAEEAQPGTDSIDITLSPRSNPDADGVLATLISPKTSTEELVVLFQRGGDPEVKKAIVARILPDISHTARKICSRLPSAAPSRGDLISEGFLGLHKAINAFDISLGFKFFTFALPRIHGAMLDFIRNVDWVPRLVRQRGAKVERLTQSFYNKNGYHPNRDELRDLLQASEEEFKKIERDGLGAVQVGSIYTRFGSSQVNYNKEPTLIDTLHDPLCDQPDQRLEQQELQELLDELLANCSTNARNFVQLYFLEGITMKRIAEQFNCSESRVSQLVDQTLAIMRERYIDMIRSGGDDQEQRKLAELLSSSRQRLEGGEQRQSVNQEPISECEQNTFGYRWIDDPQSIISPDDQIDAQEEGVVEDDNITTSPIEKPHHEGPGPSQDEPSTGNPDELAYRWTE